MAIDNGNGTVTVVSGDTLYAIAKKYGTTVNAIVELNKDLIKNPNLILVGWVLRISSDAATTTTTTTNVMSIPNVKHCGLLANSDRTVYASWDWNRENTDHFVVRWYYSWGVGEAPYEEFTTAADLKYHSYTPPDYATHVTVYVKAVSKTYKDSNTGNEISYWADTGWGKGETYWFKDNPPKTPNAPTVEIKDYTLTATLTDLEDLNAESIEFHVYQDNGHLFAAETVKIVTYQASCTFNIEAGHDYKVQARAWRGEKHSDWSGYSGNQGTKPAASDGITTCIANSATSVYLAWEPVANAETYDIEYSTNSDYFDSSDQTDTVTGITTPNYIKTGLESGKEYFFRVRAVNSNGHSAWSGTKSIILGKKPSAPTTWSSTTVAIVGELLNLYWVHNSEDGSKQVSAELELTVDGETTIQTIEKEETPDDEEEKTSFYNFDTSGYVEGTTLKWRVRTCGITGEYSDWSIQRVVDIYARPTLSLNVVDLNGSLVETLTSFPFRIIGIAGPNTQKPIGYHLSIIATDGYETVDHIGNKMIVNKNGEVYAKYFDIYSQLDVTLSVNDLDLENTITYIVKCIVTMDSGLTAEASMSFTVDWSDEVSVPFAEIGINKDSFSAVINPYCVDVDNELIDGITLSVYRREFDGTFTEIGRNMPNTRGTFVTDPHPALDYARYRIVATSESTGAINYNDIMIPSISENGVIIQWNEEWTDFDVTEYGITEDRPWSGSLLRLPYNIDTTEKNQPDVELVEYIGRKHPVSYYGTQLGETATWNVDIAKSDKETLYALRRLKAWMADVYVREPSGVGYWANITVSFSQKHCEVTIPVTLEIARVEGGV